MFSFMGGNRQLRTVRIVMLVGVIGAGVLLHHHGTTYSAVRVLYYAVIFGLIGAALWRSQMAKRSRMGSPVDPGDDRDLGGPSRSYRYGTGQYDPPAGIPEGPPQVAPLESAAPFEATAAAPLEPTGAAALAETATAPLESSPPAALAETAISPLESPPPAAAARPPVASAAAAPLASPAPQARAAAPGWYSDPADAAVRHYWDGLRWTERVRWDGNNWVPAAWGQSA